MSPSTPALTAAAIAAPTSPRTKWFFAANDCVAIVTGVGFEAARALAAQRLGVPQSAVVLRSRRG